MIPPVYIFVRVGRIYIPAPLVLLWPVLIGLFVLALVVLPFVPIKGTGVGQRAALPLHVWRTLAALRGTRVDVQAHDGTAVRVRCW